MKRRIKDFLPEECVDAYREIVYNDKMLGSASYLMGLFHQWINTETTAELEGVQHKERKLQDTYQCPECECTVHYLNRYCHYCGTKLRNKNQLGERRRTQ